jgi:hypothetical protein
VGAGRGHGAGLAYDQWRSNVFSTELNWNLEMTAQFDAAAEKVRPDDVRGPVLVSADLDWHVEQLGRLLDLGVQGLYLHHVGQDQDAFIDTFAAEVLPQLTTAGKETVMSIARTGDLWWKNAIVYCLDVETFLDTDGDGAGDLAGLTERLDHLAGLGVTCLWLMPFYPSPNHDDGYDITDYYGVDERLGSLGDFVALVRTAKDRGLRVIVDLVVNHTSDQHPWFRSAKRSRNSRYRDYYVWRDEPQEEPHSDVVFPDAEDSIWTYDERTDQYYLHHFYSHQPDVNIANPRVRDEMAKVAGFWLQLGDRRLPDRRGALPARDRGPRGELDLDPHAFLKDLRSFMARRKGDALLLGEVNLPTEELVAVLRRRAGRRTADAVRLPADAAHVPRARAPGPHPDGRGARGDAPRSDDSQWAIFIRNHDELTLDQLSDDERDEVFAAFGPDESMQLFGRGLRRRLPRCSTATSSGSGWSTACCSRCPAPPCCSTARRSGWARTSTSRGA